MAEPKQIVIGFASEGMSGLTNPALISERGFARATNVMIHRQMPTTRYGVRAVPLSGDAVDSFRSLNFQGATFYNPSRGQSGQSFSKDDARIVASAGGRKFSLKPDANRSPRKSRADVTDVSGGIETSPDFHLVHLFQAENYVVSGDGNSDTWIWDGTGTARTSKGFNIDDKEKSELPNGAFLGVYAHGRIVQSVDGSQLSIGDIIHKSNQTSAENILQTTEQVYWATGLGIRPPTQMGKILGIYLLPIMDTAHGHGEIMVHCEDGIFSLNINIFPRDNWPQSEMVRLVLLDTGARGPYCAALYDGDQIFRSRHGIQSLRSASAQKQALGNPYHPISEAVETWLSKDHAPFVKFASVNKWAVSRRLFTTTGMFVHGAHRGGRGVISLNFSPIEQSQSAASWEGLWTFPQGIERPLQMINGIFYGRDRYFSVNWCKETEQNSLIEFDENLKHDVLPDGTESRISAQVITRFIDNGDRQVKKELKKGILSLRDVSGRLDWGVWIRTSECEKWRYWRSGQLDVKDSPCCPEDIKPDDSVDLRGFCDGDFDLALGELPSDFKVVRKMQFLIRWRGRASLEALSIRFSKNDDSDGDKEPSSQVAERSHCDYSDYEYSSNEKRWESCLNR